MSQQLSRCHFIKRSLATTSAIITKNAFNNKTFGQAPSIVTSSKRRPQIPYGVTRFDINNNSAVIWSKINPIDLIVPDGKINFENFSNGDGSALGRELEVADLLQFIKKRNIKNVVWLTADVHYAAHYYDPNKAQYKNFKPFWEFVAGPLNSGTFGLNKLDNTFGLEVKYQSVSAGMKQFCRRLPRAYNFLEQSKLAPIVKS